MIILDTYLKLPMVWICEDQGWGEYQIYEYEYL